MISDFRRERDKSCALLENHAACIGNPLPTFQNNLSFPSSKIQKLYISWPKFSRPMKMGPIGCPETSLRTCHNRLSNIPEERRSFREVYLIFYCNVYHRHCFQQNCRLLDRKVSIAVHSLYFYRLKQWLMTLLSMGCTGS